MLGQSYRVCVIHRTLTWTTGYVSCVRDHYCGVRVHTGSGVVGGWVGGSVCVWGEGGAGGGTTACAYVALDTGCRCQSIREEMEATAGVVLLHRCHKSCSHCWGASLGGGGGGVGGWGRGGRGGFSAAWSALCTVRRLSVRTRGCELDAWASEEHTDLILMRHCPALRTNRYCPLPSKQASN